ncbi:type II secretion system protein GspM [Vibrio sp. RC27]
MKDTMVRLRSWWSQISSRERWLVGTLAGLGLLVLFVFGFWQPMNQSLVSSKQALEREKSVLQTVMTQSNRIESLRKEKGIESTSQEPLNQVIAASSKKLNISLIRIQPRDQELQVWVEPLRFDTLLDWINTLDRNFGIQVVALDIERSDKPGMVDVRRLQFR